MRAVLGIDIAKLSFEAALLIDNKKFYCKKFGNSQTGIKKLEAWLSSKGVMSAHACMEATGKYGLMLAEWLSEHGFTVSMVNPASIKGFAQSQLLQNKTDAVDVQSSLRNLHRLSIQIDGVLRRQKYASCEHWLIDVKISSV